MRPSTLVQATRRRYHRPIAFIHIGVSFAVGCELSRAPDTAPGVSWELAAHRAETISDVGYEINLSIPDSLDERVLGRETIRFGLSDARRPLVIDFEAPRESVISVRTGAGEIEFEVVNGHIVVPASALAVGGNAISIDFIAGDGSLNRNREFLYTLFVPDRARFALPVFDQPNLKARYTLSLEVPASWLAVANGALLSHEVLDDRAIFQFAETKPISTYIFAFAAGEFQVETEELGGRELRMFHRETDSTKVARNREAVFDLHQKALDWLEAYTGIEYPFDKFEFVLIPSFQYRGMEHPGAILYRDSWLFLDESATQEDKLGRAGLIAHETAHMWFGNLVTMEWFNDVWMKEVFASFMAAKIVNPSFPEIDHQVRFLLAHHPGAYAIDRTAGANPIRQQLDNLNEAGMLYGAIIYGKAPIVMRQLEALIGPEDFRDGVRLYLDRFRFGNATWPDLIGILDARSPEDLAAWSDVWVGESGRPTVRTALSLDEAGGSIASLALEQHDPEEHGRLWNQQLAVLLAYSDRSEMLLTKLDDRLVDVAGVTGRPTPDFILPDGSGMGYGLFQLDSISLANLPDKLPSIPEAVTRGVAWLSLWDAMLEGLVPPGDIVDLAARALVAEDDELLVGRILAYLGSAYWRFLTAEERLERAGELESTLWRRLEGAEEPTLKASLFNAYRSLALTDEAVRRLERIWRQEESVEGLTLSERDYTTLALQLAVREVDGWERILDEQYERIENPDRKEPFAFVRPALSADGRARDRFFESLKGEENREHEPWVLEGLSYLHHPLRAAESERYILPSLELVEEIQRTGDVFFPQGWLDATLGGHSSEAAAGIVCEFLSAHPDYPPKLKGKIQQSADPLFRSAAILYGFATPSCSPMKASGR